jgi:hypothetical protein
MNINLTISATPELTELLLNITGLLNNEVFRSAPIGVGNFKHSEHNEKSAQETEGQATDTINETYEENKEDINITLEGVRAILAAISQNGKQPQVKELLQSFGAIKLSDIDPKNYVALLKEAEKI